MRIEFRGDVETLRGEVGALRSERGTLRVDLKRDMTEFALWMRVKLVGMMMVSIALATLVKLL